MQLKMYEIVDFPVFFEKVKTQKLSFKTSYRLTLLAQEVEKHINYYQEQFRGLLAEYGKKDEEGNLVPTYDGQGILLAEETMAEAYEKLAELRVLEVELPDTTFSVEDFENVEMSPQEMLIIMPFIKD